jgi:CubicO group peptidase (beta-lactamase class C family)
VIDKRSRTAACLLDFGLLLGAGTGARRPVAELSASSVDTPGDSQSTSAAATKKVAAAAGVSRGAPSATVGGGNAAAVAPRGRARDDVRPAGAASVRRRARFASGSRTIGSSETGVTTLRTNDTQPVIGGDIAPGFEKVREVFAQNAADAGDGGFAFAAYHEGRKVVDIWTGPGWTSATTPLWMSVTKAMTALCVQILWDRGKVDVDAPILDHWPEFAAAGKSNITIADVMTHRSGVVGTPALTEMISLDDGAGIDRTDEIVEILAAAEPVWEPGTKTGYHTVTYGWLLGEIIRRVDGRDLGSFFREEVALPLGLDNVWMGTPAEHHGDIPAILPMMWPDAMPDVLCEYMENVLALARDPNTPAGISCFARNGAGILDRIPEVFNNAHGRIPPLGASNLCGAAADVAKIFAAMAEPNGLDGVELASTKSRDAFTEVRNTDDDINLLIPIGRALGYWRNLQLGRPQVFGPNEEAFGHTGMGGQIGYADPKARVGAAFVRSHYTSFGFLPLLLNAALYDCVG